jgi:hypothetical protein
VNGSLLPCPLTNTTAANNTNAIIQTSPESRIFAQYSYIYMPCGYNIMWICIHTTLCIPRLTRNTHVPREPFSGAGPSSLFFRIYRRIVLATARNVQKHAGQGVQIETHFSTCIYTRSTKWEKWQNSQA